MDFVEPRKKVHHIDEGYVWVPKMRGFTKDLKHEFSGNQIFQAREASHPCNYASRGRDSSYLGLFSTVGLRKRVFYVLGSVWVKEKWDFRVLTMFFA